jgi:glycosyltransferase involved in cell wall biosynthesis
MRRGWSFRAAREIGTLVREREIVLVHAHTAHAHTLAWLGVARPGLAPVVVTRRVDFPIGGGLLGGVRRAKYLHPGIRLIAISSGVRDVLTAGGVPADRVVLVPSGIDPRRLAGSHNAEAFRAEIGAGPSTFVIGNAAALADHKGQIYLVRAAERIRQWFRNRSAGSGQFSEFRIAILGEGEERSRLEAEIRERRLQEQVRLLGWRDDVADCMAGFDVFCLSSHLEGLGTAMLDAMWMGLPVVATRTGGIPDAVADDQTGLLVPPRDPEALAEACIRYLESEDLRKRLGAAAHRRIEERFTVDRMVEGTLEVYRQALGRSYSQNS